eukprot:TRINITY_DN491_c0_g2_i1.p1 TRINITY_DN491_c0_g2~~TRINITY_DN491_c0_g2_i1.p1  ORF type:complete len:1170 (+),score=285.12 TRINITY_DN491_c0_g2_i1:88-3597(+)
MRLPAGPGEQAPALPSTVQGLADRDSCSSERDQDQDVGSPGPGLAEDPAGTAAAAQVVAAILAEQQKPLTGAALLEEWKPRTWIAYDTFLRLERDWNALDKGDYRGACPKQLLAGQVLATVEVSERDAERMDKGGGGTGLVTFPDVVREYFPNVGRWDMRRLFCSDVPGEQLLALKGSLGAQPYVTYLPKDARCWASTFEQLTTSSSGRLSLQQLKQSGEMLGPMRYPAELFMEAAVRCDVPLEKYRASFWELLQTLFPRVPPEVVKRYEASYIPISDVPCFEALFRDIAPVDPRSITADEFRNYLRLNGEFDSRGVRCCRLSNGVRCDFRMFGHIDRDRNGRVTLYELMQHFYPNVPPPMVKKAIACRNIAWKQEMEEEEDNERKRCLRLPVLRFFEERKGAQGRRRASPQPRAPPGNTESPCPAEADTAAPAVLPETSGRSAGPPPLLPPAAPQMLRRMSDTPERLRWERLSAGLQSSSPVPSMLPSSLGIDCSVPPPRIRCPSVSTLSDESVTREEETFDTEKEQPPSSMLMSIIYSRAAVSTTPTQVPPKLTPNPTRQPGRGGAGRRGRGRGAPMTTKEGIRAEESRIEAEVIEESVKMLSTGAIKMPNVQVARYRAIHARGITESTDGEDLPRISTAPERRDSQQPDRPKPQTAAGGRRPPRGRVTPAPRAPSQQGGSREEGDAATGDANASPWRTEAADEENDDTSSVAQTGSPGFRKRENPLLAGAVLDNPYPGKGVLHPLGRKAEELAWYKWGTQQKPEIRRSERRAINVGGNMTSVKTAKVAELLNYDNFDIWLQTNGKDVTTHCPNVVAVLDDAERARRGRVKRERRMRRHRQQIQSAGTASPLKSPLAGQEEAAALPQSSSGLRRKRGPKSPAAARESGDEATKLPELHKDESKGNLAQALATTTTSVQSGGTEGQPQEAGQPGQAGDPASRQVRFAKPSSAKRSAGSDRSVWQRRPGPKGAAQPQLQDVTPRPPAGQQQSKPRPHPPRGPPGGRGGRGGGAVQASSSGGSSPEIPTVALGSAAAAKPKSSPAGGKGDAREGPAKTAGKGEKAGKGAARPLQPHASPRRPRLQRDESRLQDDYFIDMQPGLQKSPASEEASQLGRSPRTGDGGTPRRAPPLQDESAFGDLAGSEAAPPSAPPTAGPHAARGRVGEWTW